MSRGGGVVLAAMMVVSWALAGAGCRASSDPVAPVVDASDEATIPDASVVTLDSGDLPEIGDSALDASDVSTPLGPLGALCSHRTYEGTPSTECLPGLLCEYTATPGVNRCTRPCVFDNDSGADNPACQDSGGVLTGRCTHELPGDPTIPAFCDLAK